LQTIVTSAIVSHDMRRERFWSAASPVSLTLAAVALTGFILAAAGLPHTHDPGRPGVYNQEHDLSYLATFGGGGPLPDAPSAVPLVVLVVLGLTITAVIPPDVWRRHADFRAPPLS
jgi:hypothetical protein